MTPRSHAWALYITCISLSSACVCASSTRVLAYCNLSTGWLWYANVMMRVAFSIWLELFDGKLTMIISWEKPIVSACQLEQAYLSVPLLVSRPRFVDSTICTRTNEANDFVFVQHFGTAGVPLHFVFGHRHIVVYFKEEKKKRFVVLMGAKKNRLFKCLMLITAARQCALIIFGYTIIPFSQLQFLPSTQPSIAPGSSHQNGLQI